MSSNGKVPDAWDDDWVIKADQSSTLTPDPPPSNTKLSKAERRARQAEFNRQLWEDAETPKNSYFLNTRGDVPLKSEFKPAMKVLSRKPTTKSSGNPNVSGLEQPMIDDDDDDDEDNEKRKLTTTVEERQQSAQREREEKQKKYEEARQRLFGSENLTSVPSLTNNNSPINQKSGELRSRSKSKAVRDGRPPSTGNKTRQLFDPNFTSKPDSVNSPKKENQSMSRSATPTEQQPIRSPRGPDNSGRGGFGFATRGGRGDRAS